MNLLFRPSLFKNEQALLEIDSLLSESDLSFSLFLSRTHIILANSRFLQRWNLVRAGFPRFSLADHANQIAQSLSGETKGRFWDWASSLSPHPSLIDLPDPESGKKRFILKVPTKKESAEDPFFLEKISEELDESGKEALILLGRRIRTPARIIIRSVSDELLIDHFFKDELGTDPNAAMAQVYLSTTSSWSPSAEFWRVRYNPDEGRKLIAESLSKEESKEILPFRRILFAKNPGEGYWADFPLLYNRTFFGKVRLFRPESRKRELPGLSSFQPKVQVLSRNLFEIRKNLGDLLPTAREPESGFLDRREAMLLIEALIEEHRITGTGFGLIGIRTEIPNHRSLMIKVRANLRFYDEIAHMTQREYLMILPAMDPRHSDTIIERIRDLLLGMNRDQSPLIIFGSISYPETTKGPMNLVRSVFKNEDAQPLQKKPIAD
jgi:hypothetical protein